MNRPMLLAAAAMASGVLAASLSSSPFYVLAALAVAAATLAWVQRRLASQRAAVVVVLAFFLAGMLSWQLRSSDLLGDRLSRLGSKMPGEVFVLEGTVREAPIYLNKPDYLRFLVDVDHASDGRIARQVAGGVVVRWTNPQFPVFPGERIRFSSTLRSRLGPVNHRLGGLEEYLRRSGIHSEARARGTEIQKLSAPLLSPRYWAARLRAWEASALLDAAPDFAHPFLLTVWLGERSELQQGEVQRFIDSGTAHILAVSGLHVGIVGLSLGFFLGLAHVPRRWRAILVMLGVFLFALSAGARTSSLRAALMVAVYLLSEMLDREPDAPNALGIAALIFLVINPLYLLDGGFLLSFGSVASILLFGDLLRSGFEWLPWWLRGTVAATLGVQVLPLPIAAAFFHVIPLAAPAANLLVIPLLGITLWLAFLTTLLAAIVPPVALLFGHALAPAVSLIYGVADFVSSLPGSHLRVTPPSPGACVLYYCAAFAVYMLLWVPGHRRRWAGVAVASLVGCAALWRPSGPAGIDFLDVGHGDATFVRSPAGETMLIDGGDRNPYTDYGSRIVGPFLYAHGVTTLDYVVATHPDRDHTGGLLHVIENFHVGTVLLPLTFVHGEILDELLAACADRDVPVRTVSAGDRIDFTGARIEVLHPPNDWSDTYADNDSSLVLRVTLEGVRVLLTGDIEAAAEKRLSTLDCAAEVMKAPHHGSATSSSAPFIDAVRPRLTVISTQALGKRSATGAGVVDRYQQRGIEIVRTDESGGIRLRCEAGKMSVEGARAARGLPAGT